MSERCVALLRGINVGTSKRIGMAALRELFVSLGAANVHTHLQSGNLVFEGSLSAEQIEKAVAAEFGVAPRVLVLTAAQFERAAQNPLGAIATDPSRLFVVFMDSVPASIEPPPDIAPDVVVIGEHAVYQWMPAGFSTTTIPPKFTRSLGPTATARNQRTVDALLGLLAR